MREKDEFFGVAKSMAIKTSIWDLGNFSKSLFLISCIFYSDQELKLGPLMTYIASSSKSDFFVWGSSGTHQGDEASNALMNT